MKQFQIRKDNFATTRLVETAPIVVETGDILLSIDQFSFTSNNITYAVMGEQLRYWQFFPSSRDELNEWGVIPVWGFATVLESKAEGVNIGERLFGYFPPSSQVKMTPVKVGPLSLFDGASHRADLPPGYNIYRRVDAELGYTTDMDAERMLLYPLFLTSFSLHDMLSDNDWFKADQVIIGSASSKTSIGLAYALHEDNAAPKVIGLTSQGNVESITKLGIYDTVFSYEQLESIDNQLAAVIVDMSANGQMLGRLHSHLTDNMHFCSNVGLTHWDNAQPGAGYIQERSEMFFAPSQIQKRMKEWGPEKFQQKSSEFIMRTSLKSRSWLTMNNIAGLDGLNEIYGEVCQGKIPPEQGIIVSL